MCFGDGRDEDVLEDKSYRRKDRDAYEAALAEQKRKELDEKGRQSRAADQSRGRAGTILTGSTTRGSKNASVLGADPNLGALKAAAQNESMMDLLGSRPVDLSGGSPSGLMGSVLSSLQRDNPFRKK